MKIITPNNPFQVKNNAANQANKTHNLNKFDEILKNTLKDHESIHPSASSSPQNVLHTSVIQLQRSQQVNKEQLVGKIEGLLDTLDAYSIKLNDPHINMHEIHPLMFAIKKENEDLGSLLSQLDEKDDLKSILDDTIQTAKEEIKHFENGDYVCFNNFAE